MKEKLLNKDNIMNIYITILLVVIPVIPLEYNKKLTTQLILYAISTVLVIIALLFTRNINLKNKAKLEKIEYVLLIYIVLVFLSALFSQFGKVAFWGSAGRYEGFFTILLYISIFYIMWKNFTFSKKIFNLVIIAVVIISIYGILQVVFDDSYMKIATGTMGNPNYLSTYLTMFLPIMMLIYLKNGKISYLCASCVAFVCLLLTRTTSGYLTFVIYSIIIIIYTIARKLGFKKLFILAICFAILFVGTNVLTKGRIGKEINSLNTEIKQASEDSTNIQKIGSGRVKIYLMALDSLLEKPVFGVGPDCLAAYLILTGKTDSIIDKTHCEYLHIAVTTGIPSLIAYLVFLILIAEKILNKYKQDKNNIIIFAIGLSILSYLIQATFSVSVTHVAPIFWAMLGIGLNLAEKGDKDEESKL